MQDFWFEINSSDAVLSSYQCGYRLDGNQIGKRTEMLESASGNPGLKFDGGGWELRSYNNFNQLTGVKAKDMEAGYAYLPNGMRAAKTVNGVTTSFTWDGANTVMETTGGSATKYIRGLNPIASLGGANTNYYLYNGHGDVMHLANTAGTITKLYDYDAFGNEKSVDPADVNPYRYSGEYFDKETGTIYLRARYYDPAIGRMLSEDSYRGDSRDSLSLNLYTYCHNDPVNFVDPSGNMDYFKQMGSLLGGIRNGGIDMLSGIFNSPKAVFDIAISMINGEISKENKLVLLGNIKLCIEDAYIPDSIPEGFFIEFDVSRFDLY